MRTFRRLCIAVFLAYVILLCGLVLCLHRQSDEQNGIYRVEAKRLADDINDTGKYDLADYPHLTGVFTSEDGALYDTEEHYLIIEAGGGLYRVEYITEGNDYMLPAVILTFTAFFIVTALVLLYIWRQIIRPFRRLNKVPQELARGNLAVPIPEEKSRFFGKFTWGVNMLRETVENSRKKEISVQREKKLLLLSLSHDIKTPLSAIKLNAKALAKGLYTDEEKRRAAAESINARADEIEHFVSEITRASSEDFMTFEVTKGEEFLSRIVARITDRYAPQLAVSGTQFDVAEYSDCLLSCDPDRLAECIQNLIENALKYGDGKRISMLFDRMDGCELITVTNSGCSLDPKELPQIFESFHRGGNAENVQGNGLGLFICRRLMSLMNGDVFADINGDDFSVTLVVRLA